MGTSVRMEGFIEISRRPLVLVHGIWSSAAMWGKFVHDLEDLRGTSIPYESQVIIPVDYKATNAHSFYDNRHVVMQGLRKARREMENRGFASIQADIVAHSMGGIFSRLWAGHSHYKRNENTILGTNYGEGDINRLILIDSPQYGAFTSEILLDLDAVLDEKTIGVFYNGQFTSPTVYEYNKRDGLRGLMAVLNKPIDRGAVVDLHPTSNAIRDMNQIPTDIPVHAIVGHTDVHNKLISNPFDAFNGVELIDIIDELFDFLQAYAPSWNRPKRFPDSGSDLIVGVKSQAAGLSPSKISDFFDSDYPGVLWHGSIYNNRSVVRHIKDLLNMPKESPEFFEKFARGFPTGPVPDVWTPIGAPKLALEQASSENDSSGVKIVSPEPFAGVRTGETIDVSTENVGTFETRAALFILLGQIVEVSAPPFSASFTIPETHIGNLNVTVLAANVDGTLGYSVQTLVVVTDAQVTDIQATPESIELAVLGAQAQITVIGSYTDGIDREIGALPTTTFTSNAPLVAQVSAEGIVTALGCCSEFT